MGLVLVGRDKTDGLPAWTAVNEAVKRRVALLRKSYTTPNQIIDRAFTPPSK